MSRPDAHRDRAPAAGLVLALALTLAGCRGGEKADDDSKKDQAATHTGPRIVRPERRDLRVIVVQPGTVQSFETTPIYSRIAGYIQRYRANIGDRVMAGDVLLDMWIPDLDEALANRAAMTKRAEVQIRVTESSLKSAEARLRTTEARIALARAGVKRAQAGYNRWESEYKRLAQLVTDRVLNEQVRDETYRQFEDAAANKDQAEASVNEAVAERDRSAADLERARADIDAARADLVVARSEERQAQVNVDYGRIKAPYAGMITQRNISPGDYLQPGGGGNRPLFILEQTDPVRVFVGVPELASPYIKDQDLALIRIQASPGANREGKVIRSGFSLNPTTRTLQTEIDIPNSDGSLRPGMYVTVSITFDRKEVWTVPSNAILFQGGQNFAINLKVGDKYAITPALIGPSDDMRTEILRKRPPGSKPDEWLEIDGREEIAIGTIDTPGDSAKPKGPSS